MFDPKPNWCIMEKGGPFGGFSHCKVLRQTLSNILRLTLWNFTHQWRGSNPKANPPFSLFPLLSLSLVAASVRASIHLHLSPSIFQTHFHHLFMFPSHFSIAVFFVF